MSGRAGYFIIEIKVSDGIDDLGPDAERAVKQVYDREDMEELRGEGYRKIQKNSRLEKSGRLFRLILYKCFSLDFFHFFYGNIN